MIKKFLQDESGMELSEYAAAAALITLAVLGVFQLLGANIGSKINSLASKLN